MAFSREVWEREWRRFTLPPFDSLSAPTQTLTVVMIVMTSCHDRARAGARD
jgi:hypothetical protein